MVSVCSKLWPLTPVLASQKVRHGDLVHTFTPKGGVFSVYGVGKLISGVG